MNLKKKIHNLSDWLYLEMSLYLERILIKVDTGKGIMAFMIKMKY